MIPLTVGDGVGVGRKVMSSATRLCGLCGMLFSSFVSMLR